MTPTDLSSLMDEVHKCKQMYEEIEEIVISNMETNNNSMLDLIKSLKIVSHNQNVLENKLEDTLKNQMNTDILVNNMNERLNNLTNLFNNKNFKKLLIRQMDTINSTNNSDYGTKSNNANTSNGTLKFINGAISILDPTVQTKSNSFNRENIKRGPGRPKKDPNSVGRTTENIDLFKGKIKLPTGNIQISKSKKYFINPINDDNLNKLSSINNSNNNSNSSQVSSRVLSSTNLGNGNLPNNKTITINDSKSDLSDNSDESGSENEDSELDSELESESESESNDDDENDEDYHYSGKGRPRKIKNKRATRKLGASGKDDKNNSNSKKFKFIKPRKMNTRNKKDLNDNDDTSDNDNKSVAKNENDDKVDIPQYSDAVKRRRGRPQKKRIVETILNNSPSPMDKANNNSNVDAGDGLLEAKINDKDKKSKHKTLNNKLDIKFSHISVDKNTTFDMLNNTINKRRNSSKGKTLNRQDMISTTMNDIDPKQDKLDKLRDPTDKMLVNMKYNDRITTKSFMESNKDLLLALKEEERRRKNATNSKLKVDKKKNTYMKSPHAVRSADSNIFETSEDDFNHLLSKDSTDLIQPDSKPYMKTDDVYHSAITDKEKLSEMANKVPVKNIIRQNPNIQILPNLNNTSNLNESTNNDDNNNNNDVNDSNFHTELITNTNTTNHTVKDASTSQERGQLNIGEIDHDTTSLGPKKVEIAGLLNDKSKTTGWNNFEESTLQSSNLSTTPLTSNPTNNSGTTSATTTPIHTTTNTTTNAEASYKESSLIGEADTTTKAANNSTTLDTDATPVKRRARKQAVPLLKSHYNLRNKKKPAISTSDESDIRESEEELELPKRKRRATKRSKADTDKTEQPNIISQAMPLPTKLTNSKPAIEETNSEQLEGDSKNSKTKENQQSFEEAEGKADTPTDTQSSIDNKNDIFSSILFGAPVELLCKDGFFYRRDRPDLPIKAGEYLDLKLRSKYEEIVKSGKFDDDGEDDVSNIGETIANPTLYAISMKYKKHLGKKDRTTAQTLTELTEAETEQTFELLGKTVLTENYVNSLEYFLMEFFWENKLVRLGLKLKESKRTWQRRRALFTLFEFWRDQTIEKRNFKQYTMLHAVKEMENYRIFINRSVSWFYNHITLLKMILYDLCDNIDSQWREWMYPRNKTLPVLGSYDSDVGVDVTADNIVTILDNILVFEELNDDGKPERLIQEDVPEK